VIIYVTRGHDNDLGPLAQYERTKAEAIKVAKRWVKLTVGDDAQWRQITDVGVNRLNLNGKDDVIWALNCTGDGYGGAPPGTSVWEEPITEPEWAQEDPNE
jgi:hypothetical protein